MEQLNIGTITSQAISSGEPKAWKNPGDVDFKVEYPADFKGEKYMPEGVVTISKESAEHFASLGIGHVVGEGQEPKPEVQSEPITHTIAEEDPTHNHGLEVGVESVASAEELVTESEVVFEPLPEITEENSGEEKVSEPVKQRSSPKPKNGKK